MNFVIVWSVSIKRIDSVTLTSGLFQESSKQLPMDDLDKLLSFMESNKLNDK